MPIPEPFPEPAWDEMNDRERQIESMTAAVGLGLAATTLPTLPLSSALASTWGPNSINLTQKQRRDDRLASLAMCGGAFANIMSVVKGTPLPSLVTFGVSSALGAVIKARRSRSSNPHPDSYLP